MSQWAKEGTVLKLKFEDKLLFIGDSITSAQRTLTDSNDLGRGYPFLVAAQLMAYFPTLNLAFKNKGMDGDTILDLVERWEKDCLNLRPDAVILGIGINDARSYLDQTNEGLGKLASEFERNYRFLLKSLYHRTDAKIMLLEPFAIDGVEASMNQRLALDTTIQVTRKMARDYQTNLIPVDSILNVLSIKHGLASYVELDGIHPTLAGHFEIAQAILKEITV